MKRKRTEPILVVPLQKGWSPEARRAAAAARKKKGGGGGSQGELKLEAGTPKIESAADAHKYVRSQLTAAFKGNKDIDSDEDNHHDSRVFSAWSSSGSSKTEKQIETAMRAAAEKLPSKYLDDGHGSWDGAPGKEGRTYTLFISEMD